MSRTSTRKPHQLAGLRKYALYQQKKRLEGQPVSDEVLIDTAIELNAIAQMLVDPNPDLEVVKTSLKTPGVKTAPEVKTVSTEPKRFAQKVFGDILTPSEAAKKYNLKLKRLYKLMEHYSLEQAVGIAYGEVKAS